MKYVPASNVRRMRKLRSPPESSSSASTLPPRSYSAPTVSKPPVVSAVTSRGAEASKPNRSQSTSPSGPTAPAVSLGSATRVAEERSLPWSSGRAVPAFTL